VSRRLALLAPLVLLALAAGVVSVRRVSEQVAVMEACESASEQAWGDVLARTAGRVGSDATGLAAAECRCRALLATGAGAECVALLEPLLADPATSAWPLAPDLAVHVIQTWRDAGRSRDAAALAARAAARHPDEPDLFYLELVTRSMVEDEESVLAELARRVPATGPAAARMRVSLAYRFLQRGEPTRALAALGDAPPPEAGPEAGRWLETRGVAFANIGDLRGVEQTYATWRSLGGAPADLFARFVLTLSVAGLQSPVEPMLSLLRRGLAAAEAAQDERLHEALAIRLILTLASSGEHDEALAVYDREHTRHALAGLTRDELLRAATRPASDGSAARGRIRFTAPTAPAGVELLVSPAGDAPADAPYAVLSLGSERAVVVERAVEKAALRWVLRDAAGRTLASGTSHVDPGDEQIVAIVPQPPRDRLRHVPKRRPADGRRRVAALVLDCADWRIARYLLARGELPVLEALLADGHRAVLRSEPPLTAAAMDALVFPLRPGSRSFVGLLHQYGTELAGLASVGENPLEPLAWLLPEESDLFSIIGAGPRRAANLLFSHGGIRAGRHGAVTGPEGARSQISLGASARDLSARERERWPLLAAVRAERDAIHLRTIAAELDAARDLARADDLDLLLLRVEPLDILTHAHFAAAVRDGQDDGERLLFEVYRYIDARLGEVDHALDADDVLVVMSDHGIETAMEHSPQALFVAVGGGVPVGRAPGEPDLRGVSRVLADLLGVATEWPDLGVAPFATRLAHGPESPEPRTAGEL
jgi:hypothetical protein